jgi:hypothetical protein
MPTINELLGNPSSAMSDALRAGLDNVSQWQEITFTKYIRLVMPLDGYIFWVRADQISQSALLNAMTYNSVPFNAPGKLITPAAQITVRAYLHYSTDTIQTDTETYDLNKVILSCQSDVDPFNELGSNVMYLGEFGNLKFGFNSRLNLNISANIYHYQGDAIYPQMMSQIIDDTTQLDTADLVVSSSIPIWLGLQTTFPLYPAMLSENNSLPPFGTIKCSDPVAVAGSPTFDGSTGSQWQLVRETVSITTYGVKNNQILDWVSHVMWNVRNGMIPMGVTNSPIPIDKQIPQREINAIAICKRVTFDVNYYQSRIRDQAWKLIKSAIPTYIPQEF